MHHLFLTAGDSGSDPVDVPRHLPLTLDNTVSDVVEALPHRFELEHSACSSKSVQRKRKLGVGYSR
jgi:hypothetical protein